MERAALNQNILLIHGFVTFLRHLENAHPCDCLPPQKKEEKEKSIYQVQGVLPEQIQFLFFKTLFNEKI